MEGEDDVGLERCVVIVAVLFDNDESTASHSHAFIATISTLAS